MTKPDITDFMSAICDQAAIAHKKLRRLNIFYLFQDKRPGTLMERIDRDADRHNKIMKEIRGV
jgi:hypothetical protein